MTFAPILLLAAGLTAQSAGELKSFTSKEGTFTVSLPGKPTEGKNDIPTAIGTIALHSYIVESGIDAYAVLYSDYPEAILKSEPDKVLDGAKSGAVGNVKGKIVSEKNVKLGDVPGRDFEYEVNPEQGPKLVGRCRIYLKKTRLYQVMVVGRPDVARSKTATEMLDSFKIDK